MSSSAGVAPLPPGFHKLLSVTFTTLAVFPSWLNLLGGDDDCMFSEPSGTCDLHIGCWQGGDSCQAIATAALRCSSTHCGLPPITDDLLSVRFCCLAIV